MKEPEKETGFSRQDAFIAVTIGFGEKWELLAELAGERCTRSTGLRVHILGREAMLRHGFAEPHFLKCKLFEEFPEAESILYFDADVAFLRPFPAWKYANRSEIVCVRDYWDRQHIIDEAQAVGLDPLEYFNSGFFIINRRHHRELGRVALSHVGEIGSSLYEQTYLNWARLDLQIPALFLPKRFNYLQFDRSTRVDEVVIGHFSDIDKLPLAEIKPYFRKWPNWGKEIQVECRDGSEAKWEAGEPLSEAAYGELFAACVNSSHEYPEGRFKGQGVVIVGGGMRYFPCAWVCLNMLRRAGCTHPVEIWHLDGGEMTPNMRSILEPLGVRCVDATEVRKEHPVRTLHGWELKAYSMLHCSFEEVLFLDADNVPLVDPAFLFKTPEYRSHGAVFWPDYSRLGQDRSIWRLCGVPYRNEPEFESGQMVVDKRRCWKALQVAMHLNEHSDFYYQHVHGDKETFHMAWRRLNQSYAMPDRGIHPLDATMCQHDFRGRRIFQHRNLDKWRLDGGNRRIPGFLFEKECLKFLEVLDGLWREYPNGVRRYASAHRDSGETAVAGRLIGARFEYYRVGYDRRQISFLGNGRIGEGAAGCEQYWNLRPDNGSVYLDIYSHDRLTMSLQESEDLVWRGRWLNFERMPIELKPALPIQHRLSSHA